LYAASFILLAFWYIYHSITFTQIAPVFFASKLDITGHLIFSTGLQQALVANSWLQLLFDILFFSLSPVLIFCFIRRYHFSKLLAWGTIVFNIVYCYLLSCISFVSIEPFIAWIFFPLLFTSINLKGFYFKFHLLRILFILFFASAGLWKLRGGGAFNIEQFSGILLNQYAPVIAIGEKGWFMQLIIFLINSPTVSFVLYWTVLLAEIFFLIGLFTKKFDKALFYILLTFLIFDYFLMEINYFSWLPFAMLFYYSRYDLPGAGE